MNAQKESPIKRCNADGAGIAVILEKGTYPMNDTPFDAGRKRAADWFAQNGYSLCVFRDLRRAEYTQQSKDLSPGARQAFDAGFAAGLADFIAGVRHG